MKNKVSGRYKTQRDGGITYDYEGEYWTEGRNLLWEAKVRCEGQFKGQPAGQVAPALENMSRSVRALIEESIEFRAGVD